MSKYIKSPKSGREIIVNGKAYNELLSNKKYAEKAKSATRFTKSSGRTKSSHQRLTGKVSSVEKVSKLQKSTPQNLSKTLAKVPKSRVVEREKLHQMIIYKDKRGQATRGWGAAAPHKGKERQELKKKCGDSCFLMPDSLGFPVCAALRENRGCKVDCRGIIAAKIRAGQWSYKDVREVADKLEKVYGCK